MSRATEEQVIGVLGANYNSRTKPALTPFINTASVLVDRCVAGDTNGVLVDDVDTQAIIESWLAGHFYEHADRMFQSRSTDGASGAFQGQTAMYLESTIYGQTAMIVDPTGTLITINKQAKEGVAMRADIVWLGTDYNCGRTPDTLWLE